MVLFNLVPQGRFKIDSSPGAMKRDRRSKMNVILGSRKKYVLCGANGYIEEQGVKRRPAGLDLRGSKPSHLFLFIIN